MRKGSAPPKKAPVLKAGGNYISCLDQAEPFALHVEPVDPALREEYRYKAKKKRTKQNKGADEKDGGSSSEDDEEGSQEDNENAPTEWPLRVDSTSHDGSTHSAAAWALRCDVEFSAWTTTLPQGPKSEMRVKVPKTKVTTDAKKMMLKLPFYVDIQDHVQSPDFSPGCILGQRGKDILVTVIPFGQVGFGNLMSLGYKAEGLALEQHESQIQAAMKAQYQELILKIINKLFFAGLFTLPQSNNPQIVIVPNSVERFCIDLTMERESKAAEKGREEDTTDKEKSSATDSAAKKEGSGGDSQVQHWRTESRKKEVQRKKRERDLATASGEPRPCSTAGPKGIRWDANKHMRRSVPGLRLTLNAQFGETLKAIADYHIEKSDGTWLIPELIDAFVAIHDRQQKQHRSKKPGGLDMPTAIASQEPILMVWELWALAGEDDGERTLDKDYEDFKPIVKKDEEKKPSAKTATALKALDAKKDTTAKDQDFKLMGNQLVQDGCFTLAIEHYELGITALEKYEAGTKGSSAGGAQTTTTATQPTPRSVLYSNMSSCHMNLHNPKKALESAEAALVASPQWFKAHLRKGDALRALAPSSKVRSDARRVAGKTQLYRRAIASYEECLKLAPEGKCEAAQEGLNRSKIRIQQLHEQQGERSKKEATGEEGTEQNTSTSGKKPLHLVAATAGFAIGSVYHDYTMATFERGDPTLDPTGTGGGKAGGGDLCAKDTQSGGSHTSYGHTLTKLVGDTLTKCGFKLWYWGMQLGYMSDYAGPSKYGGVNIPRGDFYAQWNQQRTEWDEDESSSVAAGGGPTRAANTDPRQFVRLGRALVGWGGERPWTGVPLSGLQ